MMAEAAGVRTPFAIRQGGALVAQTEGGWMLATPAGRTTAYSNAQIDDTTGLQRRDFLHTAPLRLSLRARFSHTAQTLSGTAGFGFWNDPFGMSGSWPPSLPQAVWFFFTSPHSSLPLALDVPGSGFKAAVLNADRPWTRLLSPLLLPAAAALALPAAALMRLPPLHRALWPVAQHAAGIAEALLTHDLRDWHTYTLLWRRSGVRLLVDGATVLETPHAPNGPLGLVIWIDNQYLVATPQGRFSWGLTASAAPQWMQVDALRVESPAADD